MMPSGSIRRVILFRFHAHPDVCSSRVRHLRSLNPGIPIYGLYGGADENSPPLGAEFDGIYPLTGKTSHWKWKHGDLAVRQWFQDEGRKMDFDVLHLLEWDLLLAAPLEELYGHIPAGGVGLTGLCEVKRVEDRWHWVAAEPYRGEWQALLQWARRKYRYDQEPYCCLGPGCSLPREFLQRYAAERLLEFCHDELRLPLFAQILGFPLYDTGLGPALASAQEEAVFNCENKEVALSTVLSELAREHGKRAFHPFRSVFG